MSDVIQSEPPNSVGEPEEHLSRTGQALRILIYFCAVVVVFISITLLTTVKAVPVDTVEDLQRVDFSSEVAYISAKTFDWYPGALYTPDDFASGAVTEQPALIKNDKTHCFYTYRLVMQLEEGTVYGLSAYSATYAQTIWVDGALLSSVGCPGDSLETTIPMTSYFTIYFTASSTPTEIVIQRSDFVHAAGGQLYPQYFGEQTLITRLNDGIKLRGSVVVGSMLTAALFFLGIFLFFQKRRHFLWFALSCLMITFRTLSMDHKLIMTLLPNMNWVLSHKLEYFATAACLVFFFLYVSHIFERKLPRVVSAVLYSLCGVYTLVTLVTPSTIYTRFLTILQYGVIGCLLVAVFFFIRGMLKDSACRRPEHIAILFGTIVAVLMIVIELIRYNYGGFYEDLNLTQTGMMVFVFANTLALALSFTRIEAELSRAQQREQEMQETTHLLERLNSVKADFLANISHEMRTPLTVMGSYAALTSRQIQRDAVDEQTLENLDIVQKEAVRLGKLVEQVKAVALEKERQLTLTNVDAQTLLRKAADFCQPLCQGSNNAISVYAEPEHFSLRLNEDAVFQVLFNLITNANRHTTEGTIRLSATADDRMATLSVADSGEGIAPEILDLVYTRGFSNDGSDGLGLAICRDIVEEHGGVISIESELGTGTTVSLTLPLVTATEDGDMADE